MSCDETNSNTTRIMRMDRGFDNAPATTIDGGLGLVEARLVQVTHKLFEAYQGCVSDLPEVCFGIAEPPPGEILRANGEFPVRSGEMAGCIRLSASARRWYERSPIGSWFLRCAPGGAKVGRIHLNLRFGGPVR